MLDGIHENELLPFFSLNSLFFIVMFVCHMCTTNMGMYGFLCVAIWVPFLVLHVQQYVVDIILLIHILAFVQYTVQHSLNTTNCFGMLTMMKSSAWMIVLVLWICSHFWWTVFNLLALVDNHGIVFYHQNWILLVNKWILLSPMTNYQLYWHSFSSRYAW